MVIGRKPGSARFDPANAPALVTVPSPREEISKSHLGIVLEEWRVLVVDLGATNGTVLRRPGAAHRRLGRLEEVLAKNGDVFDLGEGVTVEIGGMP
jgi:pSer/pThr/pTyr-binding forkhead associated (FHA) protein